MLAARASAHKYCGMEQSFVQQTGDGIPPKVRCTCADATLYRWRVVVLSAESTEALRGLIIPMYGANHAQRDARDCSF